MPSSFVRHARSVLLAAALASAGACGSGDDGASVPPQLSQIEAQIFSKSCTFSSCHGELTPREDLSLAGSTYDRLVGKMSTEVPSKPLVKPGDPDGSYLYEKLTKAKPTSGDRMPQGQEPLGAAKLAAIRDWIKAGASKN